jgi:thioredoxin 1
MPDEELERLRALRLAELTRAAETGAADEVAGEPVARDLTAADFDAFVADHDVALIDFWAAWCGPCRTMEPVVAEVAQKWRGKAAVGKVNVDQEAALAQRFGVMSIPTFYVFKGGRPLTRMVGVQMRRDFDKALDQATGTGSPERRVRRL